MANPEKPVAKRDKNPRLALLRAAERLFAERGVDSVSLREIAAAAGQGNHSAALYHFGGKRELVNALLERHSDPIQLQWTEILGQMRAEGQESLEGAIGLLVQTLVAKLDDPDGGVDYLIVVSQLVNSRSFPITELKATSAPGILALNMAIMRHIDPIPMHLLPLRMLHGAAVLYGGIASYQRLVSSGFEIPRQEFVDDLIGCIVGLLNGRRALAR